MLCLAKGEAIDREFLSKLLWAGRFEAHAKASLRQCLLELGKVLASCGQDILVTGNQFALFLDLLLTDPASGDGQPFTEIAVYTVRCGQIAEERYFYV